MMTPVSIHTLQTSFARGAIIRHKSECRNNQIEINFIASISYVPLSEERKEIGALFWSYPLVGKSGVALLA